MDTFHAVCIYIKVGENSDTTRIKHVCDIEKALNIAKIHFSLDNNV